MATRSGPVRSHAQKAYLSALERAFASGRVDEFAATVTKSGTAHLDKEMAERKQSAPAPAPSEAPGPTAVPAVVAPAQPGPDDEERLERRKHLQKILEAESRDDISRSVDRYTTRFGELPDDFEVFTKALAHRDDGVVLATLTRLEEALRRRKPKRARSLAGQLRLLEETHDEPEVRQRATLVRSML